MRGVIQVSSRPGAGAAQAATTPGKSVSAVTVERRLAQGLFQRAGNVRSGERQHAAHFRRQPDEVRVVAGSRPIGNAPWQ